MGYKTKEIIGKNVKLLMPERYAIEHDQYLENYLTTGRKKVIGMGRDLPIKMKDGTEKLCNLTVVDHQQTGTRYDHDALSSLLSPRVDVATMAVSRLC